MIDTVCLIIPVSYVVFLDERNEAIPNWNLQAKTENYRKYIKNPSKQDRESGLYFPRITLYQRRYSVVPNVKIEFSAPKMLFENNLDELTNEDFDSLIDTLQDRLKRMGLRIFKRYLIGADVSAIHFSKNIQLENGLTSSYIISQISKIDLRKTFDFARARFINDGQSLVAHTASHELVLYDKIADLNKPKKRAIDRDQTRYQLELFQSVRAKSRLIEVLRIEIRLTRKQKLKSVLRKAGFEKQLTFQNVFNVSLAKTIIWNYWEDIIKSRNVGLFCLEKSPKAILREIYHANANMKPNRAIYLTGLVLLGRDENGLRELKSIASAKCSDRTCNRLIKDFAVATEMWEENSLRGWVKQIEKTLIEFKPLNTEIYDS